MSDVAGLVPQKGAPSSSAVVADDVAGVLSNQQATATVSEPEQVGQPIRLFLPSLLIGTLVELIYSCSKRRSHLHTRRNRVWTRQGYRPRRPEYYRVTLGRYQR